MRAEAIAAWMPAFLLLACFGSVPPPPNHERIKSPDGKWLEERIVRNLSRRPEEVYFVYKDSGGNYLRHGTDTHYYLNGQVKLAERYKNGLLDSLSEFWYPNGNKRGELSYAEGKLQGAALSWYPNGKKQSEKHWENGQLHGVATDWDERGVIRKQVLWSRNKIEKVIRDENTQ